MINSNFANRPIEVILEEGRLVRQAKSGDINAFVQLYDAFVERVYRYVHFLVPNNRVAEGLTFQVFFKAWEHLDRYQILGSSFVSWLYSIAQNQVGAYYRTHKKTVAPDNDFTLAVRGGDFREELQAIRDGLQFLTADQQQVLILKFILGVPNKNIARILKKREWDIRVLQMYALQSLAESLEGIELKITAKGFQRTLEECLMRISNGTLTLDECLLRYPEFAKQLKPILKTVLLLHLGRDVRPSATFNAYTHDALIQYVRSHPRQPQIVMPLSRRAALTFAMVVAALLVTGTAQAQSALPGDTFYGWKRTTEQIWLTFSINPLATNIILAERRLNELIAVADDPTRSADAMNGYLEALESLEPADNAETLMVVVPALQLQQQTLSDAGLSAPILDGYLNQIVVVLPPVATPTHVPPPTATNVPPTATDVPPPTATDVPPPTATDVPPPTATDIPPTATDIPPTATDIPPTATDVPPPTATDVPPTPEPTSMPDATPTEETP